MGNSLTSLLVSRALRGQFMKPYSGKQLSRIERTLQFLTRTWAILITPPKIRGETFCWHPKINPEFLSFQFSPRKFSTLRLGTFLTNRDQFCNSNRYIFRMHSSCYRLPIFKTSYHTISLYEKIFWSRSKSTVPTLRGPIPHAFQIHPCTSGLETRLMIVQPSVGSPDYPHLHASRSVQIVSKSVCRSKGLVAIDLFVLIPYEYSHKIHYNK